MIDDSILSRARSPKGKRTLQAILDATYELVSSGGMAAASQEAVASGAGLTQSAVRHYFPKKEDLLDAFFEAAIERMEHQFEAEFARVDKDPRLRLIKLASLHYDRILENEDVAFFEIASAWARNPEYRKFRDNWWQRINRYYLQLVREIHPDWSRKRCTATAFQIMTLVLGGWVTMGSSHPLHHRLRRKTLKAMLIDGIERLID